VNHFTIVRRGLLAELGMPLDKHHSTLGRVSRKSLGYGQADDSSTDDRNIHFDLFSPTQFSLLLVKKIPVTHSILSHDRTIG
jgi:hypothetical protein